MTIEGGTAIVLAYVLVSMGVIIAFLSAAFVIGRVIGRLRQHGSEQSGERREIGLAAHAASFDNIISVSSRSRASPAAADRV
jgi:hypothetical protein